MAYNWQHTSGGIDYIMENKIVRVRTTPGLMAVVKAGKQASRTLAKELRGLYADRFGKPLDISEASLAAEIAIHAHLDVFFKHLLKASRQVPFMPGEGFFRKMQGHTSVIDCGEKAVDNNRFVFDFFAFFYRQ